MEPPPITPSPAPVGGTARVDDLARILPKGRASLSFHGIRGRGSVRSPRRLRRAVPSTRRSRWSAEVTSGLPLSGALTGKLGSHAAQSLVGSQHLALVIGEVADQHVAVSDTAQLREGLADLADSPDHE